MKKFDKAIIWMFGFFMVIGIIKECFFDKKADEIIVDGHHISKGPCIYAMNELFGKGIDSVKMCNCLIPEFYEMIKQDSSKIKKFEELGFFPLEGAANDSLINLFADCARKNILDSTYKVHTGQFAQNAIISKYKNKFELIPEFKGLASDSLFKCVMNELDEKLTIKEFFAKDSTGQKKIEDAILKCLPANTKNRY